MASWFLTKVDQTKNEKAFHKKNDNKTKLKKKGKGQNTKNRHVCLAQ